MTYQARRKVVLSFLKEHGLALKPAVLYRNLKFNHRITFSESTVRNILDDLVEEGEVVRVEPKALVAGQLVELGRNEGRGAYMAVSAIPDHVEVADGTDNTDASGAAN